MKCIKVLFIVYIAIFSDFLFGQTILEKNQSLKFKHYSLVDGLSQSSVICVLQDSSGFLWFGTRDGLNKFDGHQFITFRHNSQDQKSLSNSFIRSIFEDNNGELWIGTMNGLNKYNAETNNFDRFDASSNNNINKEVWDIRGGTKHYLWVATNIGLEKIDVSKKTTTHFVKEQLELSNNNTRSLWVQKNGNIWVCNTERIDVLQPKTNTFNYYPYPYSNVKKETEGYAPVLYEDKDEEIWLGYENGLWVFNKYSKVFEKFKIDGGGIQSVGSEVRSIHQDYLGNIWVGTYTGLYIINKTKTKIYHYQHNENDENSLSQNSVYTIFEDTKNDIWIGTYAGGINYYDRNYDKFQCFSAGVTDSNLNYKVVSSIAEDNEGNLWIGTEGGGINFFNKNLQRFEYFKHNDKDSNSLSANNVKTIIKTKKGNLWIGTHDGGLNFLNLRNKPFRFKTYKNVLGDTTSISSNRVIALHEDEKGDIWIGTSGSGLNVFSNNRILRINDSKKKIGSIIYTISKTSDPDVLLVGGDKGLVKLNTITHKIYQIKYRGEQSNGSIMGATLDVFEDRSTNLWIATEGDGLYYYNNKTSKSIKYDMNNGLPNSVVYSILPDENNNLWLSTNNGLSRLNLETLKFDNFNSSDGLTSNEFNHGACIKLANNDLMFGGANGLNFFNPSDIIQSSFIPPVSITSISVNNKPFYAKEGVIDLKYDQNVFSFSFVALGYSNPMKCEYAYKLDGFDEQWNYVGNNRFATYTNLDAGTYYFNVKSSNSNGVWRDNGVVVRVEIQPAPWKTWWAYFIYVSVFIGILMIVRKYSLLRIHEKNQLKQERLEKEKLEEINSLKLQLFTNISHDFRTPLTLVIGPLERMLAAEKVNDFVQEQLETMHRNAKTLLQLMNQLLDFRKSQSGKIELKVSKNNIVTFIDDIKLAFADLARERSIEFSFHAPNRDIKVWFDLINLKKVIFNLLSNAFKFTADNGAISIKILEEYNNGNQGHIRIVIKDNGIGIPAKNIKFIFDRFYQLDQKENTRSGTGIGLALTKNLIELHKGEVYVESVEGKGCSFNVLLPLGNEHFKDSQIIDGIEYEGDNRLDFSSADEKLILTSKNHTQQVEPEENVKRIEEITILIVEDNNEVRNFIKDILKINYSILEAPNGVVALEISKHNKIDLIISDLMMPEMGGMEFCEKIKSNISTSHIPVILLTAKTSEESQKKGYEHGADAYILKPFNANILQLRVANLIKARKILIEKYRKDIILEPTETIVTSSDELFLQKAIGLIEENINNSEYTIQNFIADIGMSRSALYRKLKALTNQTITEFIRTIKLKRARQLILNTEENISGIAFELGFSDLKHFRKIFKELFNELPSQCRSNNIDAKKDVKNP